MLRSSRAAAHGSLVMFQALDRRRRLARRRAAVISAVLALTAAGMAAGALLSGGAEGEAVHRSPLSYLPL